MLYIYIYIYIYIGAGDKIEKNEMGGHVARMGEERGRIGSWWGNRRERDHWGDLDVDG